MDSGGGLVYATSMTLNRDCWASWRFWMILALWNMNCWLMAFGINLEKMLIFKPLMLNKRVHSLRNHLPDFIFRQRGWRSIVDWCWSWVGGERDYCMRHIFHFGSSFMWVFFFFFIFFIFLFWPHKLEWVPG